MASFTFYEPSNDAIDAPTADQVIGAMRENGDYWGPYSPVGQLSWDDTDQRCQLFFVRHPRRGWYIEFDSYFTDGSAPKRHVVAVDPTGDRNAWVEHWAEGETAYFLAACFLPQAVAEQAVLDFFAAPVPSPAVTWETVDWRVHRREGPPDDESLVIEEAESPD